jgi:hypothetical protein
MNAATGVEAPRDREPGIAFIAYQAHAGHALNVSPWR